MINCSKRKHFSVTEYYTLDVYSQEKVSFVFPRVLKFPETKSREKSGLKGKQN